MLCHFCCSHASFTFLSIFARVNVQMLVKAFVHLPIAKYASFQRFTATDFAYYSLK